MEPGPWAPDPGTIPTEADTKYTVELIFDLVEDLNRRWKVRAYFGR